MAAKKKSAAKKSATRKAVTKKAADTKPAKKTANKWIEEYREKEMRYLAHLPRQPIPKGRFLVHNHINPANPLGSNGFRAWTQNDDSELVECKCDFGGCKNAELHKHYRVRALVPARSS